MIILPMARGKDIRMLPGELFVKFRFIVEQRDPGEVLSIGKPCLGEEATSGIGIRGETFGGLVVGHTTWAESGGDGFISAGNFVGDGLFI